MRKRTCLVVVLSASGCGEPAPGGRAGDDLGPPGAPVHIWQDHGVEVVPAPPWPEEADRYVVRFDRLDAASDWDALSADTDVGFDPEFWANEALHAPGVTVFAARFLADNFLLTWSHNATLAPDLEPLPVWTQSCGTTTDDVRAFHWQVALVVEGDASELVLENPRSAGECAPGFERHPDALAEHLFEGQVQ